MPNWNLSIPPELHARTRRIAKTFGLTCSQLCRLGLDRVVYEFELRLQAEAAHRRQEREWRRPAARRSTLLGASPLAPQPAAGPAIAPIEQEPAEEPTDPLCAPFAEKIARAASPLEKRLCLAEAIAAIKKSNPLTHPNQIELLARLEKAASRVQRESIMQPQAPPSSTMMHEPAPPTSVMAPLADAIKSAVVGIMKPSEEDPFVTTFGHVPDGDDG